MGKYKSFIVLGIAVVVALITSFMVYRSLQQKGTEKERPALVTQPVAVAEVDLAWGTVLTKEKIKTSNFLKDSLPPGSFSDAGALIGRVLVYPVKADEPILESRLAPRSIKTGGVAAVVASKKRAVSVKVDKVIGVSGFIHAGNRVDVLVTLPTGKASLPTTKTILENILVLAIGPETEPKGKEGKSSPVDVITMEVTPEEAEKLALAATEGRILLALRNFDDNEDVLTKGVTPPVLLASYFDGSPSKTAAKKGRAATPSTPKASTVVVEMIRGGKITTVKFEGEN